MLEDEAQKVHFDMKNNMRHWNNQQEQNTINLKIQSSASNLQMETMLHQYNYNVRSHHVLRGNLLTD